MDQSRPRQHENTTFKTRKREVWIDSLRGLSMLGIMIVNFPSINTLAGKETTQFGFIRTPADQWVASFIMVIFNAKMYPIFVMLFGLGTYIFMKGAQNNGLNPYTMIIRRLGFLMILGLLHLSLVWWGDILLAYSITGFALISFYSKPSKRILRTALFNLIGIAFLCFLTALGLILTSHGPQTVLLTNPFGLDLSSFVHTYGNGSYATITRQRILDYIADFTPLISPTLSIGGILSSLDFYFQLAGLFLLGFWFASQDLHKKIWNHLKEVKAVFWVSLLFAGLTQGVMKTDPSFSALLNFFQCSAQSVSYVCAFILIYRHPRGQALLQGFSSVGKMSLTAYLMHTVSFTTLLYGYGGGLYGKIGPAWTFVGALGFYGVTAVFCHQWLKSFEWGPAEWVWRRFTYSNQRKLSFAPVFRR